MTTIPARRLRSGQKAQLIAGGPIYRIDQVMVTTHNGSPSMMVVATERVTASGRVAEERHDYYLGLQHTCYVLD